MNIGVFDSGLGGLSVLRELLRTLPEYNYIYLGDNARTPYGNRSPKVVHEYTRQAVEFLIGKNCSLIILACNSASAVALRKIQKNLINKYHSKKRVLGVIRPAVEVALAPTTSRIGVIGTTTTIESNVFKREIGKLASHAEVYQQPCPLLVPIIEEGELAWEGLNLILHKYLRELKKKRVEKLILGCTHYGLISSSIKKEMGKNVAIVNVGKAVAEKLKVYLVRHPDIEKHLGKHKTRKYFVTDLNNRYHTLVKFFLKDSAGARLKLVQLR